jgi:transposase-like protein
MSSKKITDADKLEIVDLYRQSGDTTASLANRYGVSNSTISRLLKNNIAEAEYEMLIQQKRVSKVGGEEESLADESILASPAAMPPELEIGGDSNQSNSSTSKIDAAHSVVSIHADDLATPSLQDRQGEDNSENSRRIRRRSSAPLVAVSEPIAVAIDLSRSNLAEIFGSEVASTISNIDISATSILSKTTVSLPVPRTPVLREILSDSKDRYSPPSVVPAPPEDLLDEVEDDEDNEDVNVLAAMFGEEISEGDDDEEFAEDDDEAASSSQQLDRNQLLTSDLLHVQVTPLSQATLPRTCYIVIDKFAELIVRPLKDFADLGQISGEEIQQRTLPIFDNPRVAKRFSNQRTQRVIKVPDSRVFYKTTEHLRSKGITRLLVDGNIYSLN